MGSHALAQNLEAMETETQALLTARRESKAVVRGFVVVAAAMSGLGFALSRHGMGALGSSVVSADAAADAPKRASEVRRDHALWARAARGELRTRNSVAAHKLAAAGFYYESAKSGASGYCVHFETGARGGTYSHEENMVEVRQARER